MTYLEKEQRLIQRLNETNYDQFDDKNDALTFLEQQLTAFSDYANIVIKEQIMIPIWKRNLDIQDYQAKTQDIETKRQTFHNDAISAVNILNRVSANLGLEPFSTVDTNDRHEVAKFIGEFISETYNIGINNPNKEVVYQQEQEYDDKVIKKRLREIDAKFGDMLEKDRQGGTDYEF